jgi:hypothetical protein
MDKDTEKLLQDFLQNVEIDDEDRKRKSVVPDDMLARAFKFVSKRRPWASDADVLRELVLKEVLRSIEGSSKDERLKRIEEKLAQHDGYFMKLFVHLGLEID